MTLTVSMIPHCCFGGPNGVGDPASCVAFDWVYGRDGRRCTCWGEWVLDVAYARVVGVSGIGTAFRGTGGRGSGGDNVCGHGLDESAHLLFGKLGAPRAAVCRRRVPESPGP